MLEFFKKSRQTKNNRIFTAPVYLTYREAVTGLASQGIRAFYKGTLFGLLRQSTINSVKIGPFAALSYRSHIDGEVKRTERVAAYLVFFTLSTIIDMIVHPLHVAQSRMILMDARKEFRVYKNAKQLMKSGYGKRNFMFGAFGNIPLNIFSLGLLMENKTIAYVSGLTNTFLVYPIITCMRRVECQVNDPGMIHKRYEGVIHALKLIFKEEGARGLYRGFGAYLLHQYLIAQAIMLFVNTNGINKK